MANGNALPCIRRMRNFAPNMLVHGQLGKPGTQSLTFSSGLWLVKGECEMDTVWRRHSRAAGPLFRLDMSDFS